MLFAIALTSVLSVDIDAHSSYKGRTTRETIVRITRSGNGFVANGSSVSASAVQALVDAVEAPPMNAPTPEALRVGIAELAALEPGAMRECEGVAYAPGAQAVFQQRFTDITALADVARAYYAKPNPNLSEAEFDFMVAVTSDSGTVLADSKSSMAGMLPFTITRDGVPTTTYNAQIPTAIAALMLWLTFSKSKARNRNDFGLVLVAPTGIELVRPRLGGIKDGHYEHDPQFGPGRSASVVTGCP
jgi:hypothetical protein